ncbi:MAG: hypothetical protein KAV87_55465 [Desulfobacteraceae bacterium]|nr:hypothetical protein [Desulfobacteraceae bacterium]
MSLFQCECCGCCENTALAPMTRYLPDIYDWNGMEQLKGKELCSACAPGHFADGQGFTDYGEWHDQFPRVFLPKGMFKTNRVGNLEHIETGSEDFRQYEIKPKS